MELEKEINTILTFPLEDKRGRDLVLRYTLPSVLEIPMKFVRRDEVARLYGVSESVKNTLPQTCKNNLCLTIKNRLAKLIINKVNQTFGR